MGADLGAGDPEGAGSLSSVPVSSHMPSVPKQPCPLDPGEFQPLGRVDTEVGRGKLEPDRYVPPGPEEG